MATSTAKFVSRMDQDWAEAQGWFDDTVKAFPECLRHLTDSLADDSAEGLVRWMKSDNTIADVVQRLGLLALHELSLRSMRGDL